MAKKRYLLNERGYTMDHREIKEALGLIRRVPGQPLFLVDSKIPVEVSVPWTDIGGCQVAFLSSAEAKEFWTGPNGKRKGMYMRAIAKCPQCGKVTAASRINQHGRVHDKEGG